MPRSTSPESPPSGASLGLSLFFVGGWIYWYWFKRVIVSHAFPIVFVALAIVEVMGPLSHLIPQIEVLPIGWRASLICFLLIDGGVPIDSPSPTSGVVWSSRGFARLT